MGTGSQDRDDLPAASGFSTDRRRESPSENHQESAGSKLVFSGLSITRHDALPKSAAMNSPTNPIFGRRVLMAEDDYFIAANMQSHFEGFGAHVLGPVPSVRTALALIAATPEIDAAILDVNLQEEMVFPVADVLAARGVPFLFVTGYERTIIPERFARVRHCVKPVEAVRLARLLSLLCTAETASPDPGGTTTRPG